ncbi:MAG: hypothetical protein WDZ39_01295 [Candidatus Spechtbacterales bacterium]
MAENKKIYLISGAVLLGVIIVAGFILYTALEQPVEHDGAYEFLGESNGVVLMADTGLNIEWLIDAEDGRRQIFERYRLVSKEDFDNFTDNEVQVNSIDITKDNAEVFLTYPDSTREDIASDVPYVRLSILPPEQAGQYELDIKLSSGQEYNFEFEFKVPKEVKLVSTGKTQTVQIPDAEYNILHRSEVALHAYNLDDLNLNKASKVFHITPGGSVYGGASEEARANAGIDDHFWFDIEMVEENYEAVQESIDNLQQMDREELGPTELDYLERYERSTAFEHIFLAKVDGVWHYAKANYSEDF